MRKQDILDLFQNEDVVLDFQVAIDGQDVLDVDSALFVVNSLAGDEVFRYALGANLMFSDSVFAVSLKDTETSSLVGKYSYELWFKDSFGKDLMPFYGSLKFKSTFGRYT